MPSTLSPDHLARQAERELKAAANVRTARQANFYFKPGEEVWFFGVDTPTQRRIAGGLFQRVRGGWVLSRAASCCLPRSLAWRRGVSEGGVRLSTPPPLASIKPV